MRQSEFLYPQRCGTTCYPGSLIILLSLTVLNTFIASGLISELMKVFFIALLKERSKESSRIPKRNGAKICIHKIGVVSLPNFFLIYCIVSKKSNDTAPHKIGNYDNFTALQAYTPTPVKGTV
uniref:Secreted protein n=1 Tax=Parascaris univalens TaxID=6257 RepID=A0A915A3Q2_PARUN